MCQTTTSDQNLEEASPWGPGKRGGHGPSRVCDGFPCTAHSPLVMVKSALARRPRTQRPPTGACADNSALLPESFTSMGLCAIGLCFLGCFAPYNPYVSKLAHFLRAALEVCLAKRKEQGVYAPCTSPLSLHSYQVAAKAADTQQNPTQPEWWYCVCSCACIELRVLVLLPCLSQACQCVRVCA